MNWQTAFSFPPPRPSMQWLRRPASSSLWKWFAARNQPPRRPFGLSRAMPEDGRGGAIRETVVMEKPFGALLKFSSEDRRENGEARRGPAQQVLVVAPLSGHFAFLLRDVVAGLAAEADVYVMDWVNARHAPLDAGEFGFTENVGYILDALRHIGPDVHIGPNVHVIAVCQAVIPALAAVAVASEEAPGEVPRSLTLMAGPVDPLANPTRVVRMLRDHSIEWYRDCVIRRLGDDAPGAGRLVYPASTQLQGLMSYFTRHMTWGLELYHKATQDGGADGAEIPFLDLFASIMDLPAALFLENTEIVFLERAVWTGSLSWEGQPIDFGAIRRTALMTVEGELDDIAAPGQTDAAHCLCHKARKEPRRRMVVPGAGHFSLFHGERWRWEVMPQVKAFMNAAAVC